ncbi:19183_t:CDS:1, partial [Funneliformis geosporum]
NRHEGIESRILDCIGWIDTPAEEIIHQYFDNNCQRINDKNLKS